LEQEEASWTRWLAELRRELAGWTGGSEEEGGEMGQQ
jgi:hypothetical protein